MVLGTCKMDDIVLLLEDRIRNYVKIKERETMSVTSIKELYRDTEAYEGKTITVAGWVRTVRGSKKFGFIENLSILDLICNLGPESLAYLKQIKP